MTRHRHEGHYQDYRTAVDIAENFSEQYKNRKATTAVFPIILQDTKKKIYKVVMEWDDNGTAGDDSRSRKTVRTKDEVQRRRTPGGRRSYPKAGKTKTKKKE